jgi:hypothetical protein
MGRADPAASEARPWPAVGMTPRGISGIDLTERLLPSRPHPNVVLMSGAFASRWTATDAFARN